jgi:hypothetical protein
MSISKLFAVVGVALLAANAVQAEKAEKISGYAEWKRDGMLVVDGQRVRTDASTRFKGKILELDSVPLGYEVRAKGQRRPDGSILAKEFEARPNGAALFEALILDATNQVETKWLADGRVTQSDEEGKDRTIGRIETRGPKIDRLRRILTRTTPSYVDASKVRIYLVGSRDWNAMAMGNGAVWVFDGLLRDMDDDELAVVVAHELAHYTHEHTRRQFKRDMWLQLIALGVAGAAEAIDNRKLREAVQIGAAFSALALQNGYGRDLEDQADRVGLRYAYEGGYDVSKAPRVWQRFLDKYGETDRVTNFFFSDHSKASARRKNLLREITLNYAAAPEGGPAPREVEARRVQEPAPPPAGAVEADDTAPAQDDSSSKRKTFPTKGEVTEKKTPEP